MKSHHFFAVDTRTFMPIDCDEQGRIRVFLTRKACVASAHARGAETVGVVGMGDAKWELFQADERHVVME